MQVALILQGLVSFSLVLSAAFGDRLVQLSQDRVFLRALSDNVTHGVIAGVTWIGIILNERSYILSSRCIAEILLCTAVSSAIDVDHFINAHSLHLKDAVTLSRRPFLHCTSIPLALSCALFVVAYVFKSYPVERFAWIILAAFLSHHIRDAARRGLWLWPFGSTRPFGTSLYLFLTAVFPLCLSFLVKHVHFASKGSTPVLIV